MVWNIFFPVLYDLVVKMATSNISEPLPLAVLKLVLLTTYGMLLSDRLLRDSKNNEKTL